MTFEAAQIASCQAKAKFKKLHAQVVKAMDTPKPAKRKPASFSELRLDHCPQITRHVIQFMEKVEILVLEKLEEAKDHKHDDLTDDEIKCAVFVWVCNVVTVCQTAFPTGENSQYCHRNNACSIQNPSRKNTKRTQRTCENLTLSLKRSAAVTWKPRFARTIPRRWKLTKARPFLRENLRPSH